MLVRVQLLVAEWKSEAQWKTVLCFLLSYTTGVGWIFWWLGNVGRVCQPGCGEGSLSNKTLLGSE